MRTLLHYFRKIVFYFVNTKLILRNKQSEYEKLYSKKKGIECDLFN